MKVMHSFLFIVAAQAFLAQAFAADPAGFLAWTPNDLKLRQKALVPKMNEFKQAAENLGDFGNHTAWLAHREADGEMEIHQKWTDLMFVVSGEATLLIGGNVVNARTTSPGEIRGTTSRGGEKKVIRQGDVVQVAAGVPHQFLIPAGRQITFFTMKIAAQ